MKSRLKVMVIVVTLMLVGFSIMIALSYRYSVNYSNKNTKQYLNEQADAIVYGINQWAKSHSNVLESLKFVIEKNNLTDRDSIELNLSAFRIDPYISDAYMGKEDGTFYSGTKWEPPQGYDPRVRPWYKEAMASDRLNYSAPYLDMMTGKLAVSIGIPIRDPYGKSTGIIAEDVLLDTLIETFQKINMGGMGYPILIDESGIALYHPDRNLINTNLLENPETKEIIQNMFQQKTGRLDYYFRGEDKTMIIRTIGNTEWSLGLTVIKKNTQEGMEEMLYSMIGVAVMVSIVIGLSVFLLMPQVKGEEKPNFNE